VDKGGQVAVRGRYHIGRQVHFLIAAQACGPSVRQCPQKVRLSVERQLTNFVEEDSAISCFSKCALALLLGSGEGSSLVAKQLAANEIARRSPAVYRAISELGIRSMADVI
jgi:hypothetical protein